VWEESGRIKIQAPWLAMGGRQQRKGRGREERGRGGAAGWLGGMELGGRHGGELHAWSSARSSIFPELCGHEVVVVREEEGNWKERVERRKGREKKEKEEKIWKIFQTQKLQGEK
jgi:hypothetical protein